MIEGRKGGRGPRQYGFPCYTLDAQGLGEGLFTLNFTILSQQSLVSLVLHVLRLRFATHNAHAREMLLDDVA